MALRPPASASRNHLSRIVRAGWILAIGLGSAGVLAVQSGTLPLEEATWPEIDGALKRSANTVVVTVGAIEQHGPQIALASDAVGGDTIGPAVARGLGRALVASNIRVGVSPHHLMFPGTIAVRSDVLAGLLRETPAIATYDHPLYRETLARASVKAGRPADAEREYRHLLELTDARLDVPLHYVKAHYALAKLYDATDRADEAAPLYRRFLDYWAAADVPLPSVADAKARLARGKP